MAEDRQPADIVEGATSGDVEDEVQPTAKSAEDRKAAAALSKLDTHGADDESAGREVDQEAVQNAMNALGGVDKKEASKTVKVDAADVKLLVDEFELSKPKATELLKAHDGDAVRAMKAYLQPNF
ncbi:hypothetical protein N657DRAFT_652968 [Parathielavia appendiculata]|uniref:Nascent polypeptide-associated complex subunit alpha-like UBA domain-containing protein n=1 Tax=Parathielavia appendiculata TaxID=2587402 RepID=A0AAN6UBR9_9PEZI|nr:hypothetical protein N657DRAFT_652968 [Parathielavia appendiculata]